MNSRPLLVQLHQHSDIALDSCLCHLTLHMAQTAVPRTHGAIIVFFLWLFLVVVSTFVLTALRLPLLCHCCMRHTQAGRATLKFCLQQPRSVPSPSCSSNSLCDLVEWPDPDDGIYASFPSNIMYKKIFVLNALSTGGVESSIPRPTSVPSVRNNLFTGSLLFATHR